MLSINGKEVVINDVDLVTYSNNTFILQWDSNIGFGEMTFYKDEDGLNVETESMSTQQNKEFIKLVLNKFVDRLIVIE